MPMESTPPALDDAAATALATDMQTVIDALAAYNVNLTKDERQSATSVGPQRLAFILDYFNNKDNYPTLKPPFMNEAEANGHWDVAGNLHNLLVRARQIVELVDDLKLNSEHFAYQYALEGYATVKRGKEKNVPGADTFFDLLSPNFEGQGSTATDGGDTAAPADS
ncbi:MAG: hypothetical protein GC178_17660 [Flavobacteriales bacterium]|nr:hypothetical protein [Flavobacteriales bacterium]